MSDASPTLALVAYAPLVWDPIANRNQFRAGLGL